MNSYKENSHFQFPSRCKSPYSRQTIRNMDPTVNRIVNKLRTFESNHGRTLMPRNSFPSSNAQFLHSHHEPSTSCANQNSPDCISDFYEAISSHSQHNPTWTEYEGHFRPRRSQLESRTPANTSGYSPEAKTTNVALSPEASHNPKPIKFTDAQAKGFQMKPRQNQLRLFTGSVENLMHWSKLRNSLHILFEVTGTIVSIQPGSRETEKCFWVSDSKSGPRLQVVFYEIDRPLPRLVPSLVVTCIGRLLTRNCLQAYKVEESSEERKSDLERVSFICNRAADELISAAQRK